MDVIELKKIANEVRKGIVTSVHSAKAGHPGGSLSAADVFTYLYFEEMNIDPADPKKADRDRFVLSKGHTAPGLYSAGALLCLPSGYGRAWQGHFVAHAVRRARLIMGWFCCSGHLHSYRHHPGASGRVLRRAGG